jgi:hypothetical protein
MDGIAGEPILEDETGTGLEGMSYDLDYEKVISLMKLYPKSIARVNRTGEYPLHVACQRNNNRTKGCERVILKLLHTYPQAAMGNGSMLSSALECAVMSFHSDNSILQILDTYPEAAQTRDGDGGCLLNYAVTVNCSKKVLLALIASNLMSVKLLNDDIPDDEIFMDIVGDASHFGQPEEVIHVIKQLIDKTDYELENRIKIPAIVKWHELDHIFRFDRTQWLLNHSPTKIEGHYEQESPVSIEDISNSNPRKKQESYD